VVKAELPPIGHVAHPEQQSNKRNAPNKLCDRHDDELATCVTVRAAMRR
jgi:hypothetical protein